MGEPAPFFLLSLALADPEQSAKGLQMDTMENTWDKFQKQLQTEEESFDYEGTISFTTNKRLTQDQLNQLMDERGLSYAPRTIRGYKISIL